MKQVMKDCDVCNKAQAGPLRGCEPPGLPSYSMYECIWKRQLNIFGTDLAKNIWTIYMDTKHIAEEKPIYYHRWRVTIKSNVKSPRQ